MKSPTVIWLRRVLVVAIILLLTTTVFAGAGAAATDYGTVFVYELNDNIQGSWSYGASSITAIQDPATGKYFFAGDKIVEGLYKNKKGDQVTVKYPDATFSGWTTGLGIHIISNGMTIYPDEAGFIDATSMTGAAISSLLVTYPNGTALMQPGTRFTFPASMPEGTYKINAIFDKAGFVLGTPDTIFISKNAFTLMVTKEVVTLTPKTESAVVNNSFELVITGRPGVTYLIDCDDVILTSAGIARFDNASKTFDMPNTGKASVYLKPTRTGLLTINVKSNDEVKSSTTINVIKSSIAVQSRLDSYYIGNDVLLSGTSNVGGADRLYIYIQGVNTPFTKIGEVSVNSDNTWSKTIKMSEINHGYIDAGTYALYVGVIDGTVNDVKGDVYTTTILVFKQPFIAITDAPAVAVKENTYTVKGVAEATDKIAVYVFGTNFFAFGNTSSLTHSTGNVFNGNSSIRSDGSKFTVEFNIPNSGMDYGQYFLVVQHPMYDKKFSIYAEGTEIMLDPYHGSSSQSDVLFNILDRQTTNAAQALCNALDTQNIDDVYAKASFIVAPPLSTINPIPYEIIKGSKLTVSGSTNLGEDKFVTVEMLSTAFAAVPKETVGSTSFVALTTKTDKDGKWVVEFDTSSLNVDEYTVSVAVADLDVTTGKMNIIEGAPVVPTETLQPTVVPTVVPTETQPTPTKPTYPTNPVIYPTPTEYPKYPASIGPGYSDLTITPNTPLVPGQTVTGVFKVNLPRGSIGDTDRLQFSSPLTNAKWEIKVFKGSANADSQNPVTTIVGTSTPYVPFMPSMFSIDYDDSADVTLIVSFSGKVAETSKGQVIKVFTAEYSSSNIGSLSAESQIVYDTSNIITEINRLSKAIETVEKRAIFNAEMGVDVSSAIRELADAQAKSNAAKAAGSRNALTAYANIEAGYASLKKAEINLALAQLKSARSNLGNVIEIYNTLYAMNWITEAQFLETKVTSLKYVYDTLDASYNGGNIPDAAKLYQLLVDLFELRETADGYLTGNGGATTPAIINLRVGWNFISVPKYLDSSCDTVDELFASLNAEGPSSLGYDPTKTNGWYPLTTGMKIEPLNGYWIYAEEPQTINLKYSDDARQTPPTKTVHKGWNAIGICAEKSMTAKSSFANLDWVRYLPWNVETGRWSDPIIKGGSAENSEEIKIALGSGGWLYVEDVGTYLGSTR